jgi:hypothetical protein
MVAKFPFYNLVFPCLRIVTLSAEDLTSIFVIYAFVVEFLATSSTS